MYRRSLHEVTNMTHNRRHRSSWSMNMRDDREDKRQVNCFSRSFWCSIGHITFLRTVGDRIARAPLLISLAIPMFRAFENITFFTFVCRSRSKFVSVGITNGSVFRRSEKRTRDTWKNGEDGTEFSLLAASHLVWRTTSRNRNHKHTNDTDFGSRCHQNRI